MGGSRGSGRLRGDRQISAGCDDLPAGEPRLPVWTLAVNLSGAFLLGLLTGLALEGTPLVLAGTATLGAYTTFSTWMLETHRLTEDGEVGLALFNAVLSLVAGVTAATVGRTIGAWA